MEGHDVEHAACDMKRERGGKTDIMDVYVFFI
jgi:hypothetical protein